MLKIFNIFRKKPPTPAIVEGEFLWCIVGNIVDKRYFGEEKEIRRGTKHFRPGAKVYCIPEFGGVAHEQIRVIGRPRKSHTMINVIIQTKHVKNFRLQKVYSPSLFDKISQQDVYRETADHQLSLKTLEELVEYLPRLTEEITD